MSGRIVAWAIIRPDGSMKLHESCPAHFVNDRAVALVSAADVAAATAETAKLRALLVEARAALYIAADRPMQVSEMVAAGKLEEKILAALAETEGAT